MTIQQKYTIIILLKKFVFIQRTDNIFLIESSDFNNFHSKQSIYMFTY